MKYIITLSILVSIALGINHYKSDQVKWQKEALQEWNKMLDPMYQPPKIDDKIVFEVALHKVHCDVLLCNANALIKSREKNNVK